MADQTKIEWCDATWNPLAGCSKVSAGCKNCWAIRQAVRLASNPATPQYHGTISGAGHYNWTGKVNLAPERVLTWPLRKQKPRRIFVNSMSDLFHEAVPDDWIDRIFAVMALCPQHTFLVLTKRPQRMRDYLANRKACVAHAILDQRQVPYERRAAVARAMVPPSGPGQGWPLPNVWLGVSVEDQATSDERIPRLLHTPAAKRFVSAEPLLGPIDLTRLRVGGVAPVDALNGRHGLALDEPCERLDWVIAGGESGPGARPMHPDWPRALCDQCMAGDVPFFFKQWGAWAHEDQRGAQGIIGSVYLVDDEHNPGATPHWPDRSASLRIPKKAAGRLLDGREWNEVPDA
jgi:protein gp37